MRFARIRHPFVAGLLVVAFLVLSLVGAAHAIAHATETGAAHQCAVCRWVKTTPALAEPGATPLPALLGLLGPLRAEPEPVTIARPAPHAPRAPPHRVD